MPPTLPERTNRGMGDNLIVIALPERRDKSRGGLDQFNTFNPTAIPEEYTAPAVKPVLETYFSLRGARPLANMTADERHAVIDAILRRIENEQEKLGQRQIAGTESLATNSFYVNRIYYLKEVVAALLGNGITPEEVGGMITRGESITCRSLASLEIRRPTGIAPLFSAIQYIVSGPSGEADWNAHTDVSNVPFSTLACGSTAPFIRYPLLNSLLNLYWAAVLRGDIQKPSDLRKIPEIRPRLLPILQEITNIMEAGNPSFRTTYNLVIDGRRGKRDVYTLDNALQLYTQNPENLSALLQYLRATTKGDADMAASTRIGSLDICRICGTGKTAPTLGPRSRRLAAAYMVVLELEKMLAT
jgi:hypothetical protein